MKSKLETKISVTFFLKKISLKAEIKNKAVYATIAFKGTSAKISTDIKCEHPEKDWKAGMFHGKKFTDENHKLLNIRRTIESYETRFFKSADHIKAAYNEVEDDDIPMTILEVLDEKLIEKKDEVNRGTMKGYRSALNLFKKWMKAAHLVNFGVHRNHPHKMTNRIIKRFYKWMLYKKIGSKTSKKRYDSAIKDTTASGYISRLGALYEMFYIENNNDIDGIIVNPFRNVRKPKKRHEERQQALERELDWKWIEKIEKLKYQLIDGLVTNEVDFRKRNIHLNKLTYEERIVRDDKQRLLCLILAHTGLSFIELGKNDVFQIQRSITGPILTGRRVKTNEKYAIPVTPKVEEWIVEMGSLPWKPFVTNNIITDDSTRSNSYMSFYNYLNDRLGPHIGYDEDATISPHRFRHSFAMCMLNHFKFSLHVVARMMGDTEKMVRKHYADYDDDTITAAFNEEMTRYLKNKNNDDESEEEITV